MFGFLKRGAYVNELSVALHNTLAPLQIQGGIPGGFWGDRFCAGYMIGVYGALAKFISRGALKGEELARVGFASFEKAFGVNGVGQFRRGIQLGLENDHEFDHGARVGRMIAVVSMGGTAFDDEAIVRRVRHMALNYPEFRGLGETPEATAIYLLTKELFLDEIERRFN